MIDETPNVPQPPEDIGKQEQTVDEIERDIYLLNAIMLACE